MPPVLVLAVAAAAVGAASCGGPGELPGTADVPAILQEAAAPPGTRMGGSPARRAVREAFAKTLEADRAHADAVGARFRRPELSSYFLLSDSYVGGDFPRRTAVLLREVEALQSEYLAELDMLAFRLRQKLESAGVEAGAAERLATELSAAVAARRRERIAAVEALQRFVAKAAEVYELAASEPGSIQSMRQGLEISDPGLARRFNDLVDEVNAAHDAADAALRALPPADQPDFTRMGITRRLS